MGDPTLTKTGLLYLDAIPRLTSGADYAQLGNVLVSTCQQLATAGTDGFDDADCGSVSAAVAATELETPPAVAGAAAAKVAVACPTGTALAGSMRDDDSQHDFGFTLGTLWQRTPSNSSPTNAESGTSSLFAWDPDPLGFGDPSSSSAVTSGFTVPTGTTTFFHFHHAYFFEFSGTRYYDGADVLVQKLVNGTWTTVTGLPWVNGAAKTRYGTTTKIFGGDSHGYGSSQVNLSSLAGQTVRIVFRVLGDGDGSFIGWWLDDLRLYTCSYDVASAPAMTVAAGKDVGQGGLEGSGVRRGQPGRVVPDHPFGRQGEHRVGVCTLDLAPRPQGQRERDHRSRRGDAGRGCRTRELGARLRHHQHALCCDQGEEEEGVHHDRQGRPSRQRPPWSRACRSPSSVTSGASRPG